MSKPSDTLPPEMVVQIRHIVEEMLRELQPRGTDMPAWAMQAALPPWVETSLRRLTEAQDRLQLTVQGLAEAQARTEAKVQELIEAQARTEAQMRELIEAQKRSEGRIDHLEAAVRELTEAQARTEAQMRELVEAQKRSEGRIDHLEAAVRELTEAQARTEAQVQELIEAQKRSEGRIDHLETAVWELTEAQARTEAQVQELIEAQKRSEARIDRLEATVRGLVEVQKLHNERLDRVEKRLDRVERRLDQIGNILGLNVEVEAQEVVLYVLEQRGYRPVETPQGAVIDGEVDIVVPALDPQGRQVWVLVEVKARAHLKELRRWAQRIQSESFREKLAKHGITPPYLCYFYGARVYRPLEAEARHRGIGLLSPDGELVEPLVIP